MPAAPVANHATDATSEPLRTAVEIIPGRLYYKALKSSPLLSKGYVHSGRRRLQSSRDNNIYYFDIDSELVYWNFFLDFGPLNLGQLYRFCTKLDRLRQEHHVLCFTSSTSTAKRANAIYLICAWQMLTLNRTPEEAYRGFRTIINQGQQQQQQQHDNNNNGEEEELIYSNNNMCVGFGREGSSSNQSVAPLQAHSATLAPLPPFHDASPCVCTYDLTILDCLRGLAKARMYGFFDFDRFDVEEYEFFEQVENGDLNWIIQDRMLAFAGPHAKRTVSPEGYCTLTPKDYIPYFKKKKVVLVVRLNKKCYDESQFTREGIAFEERYYPDGSCPPLGVLQSVLQRMESVPANRALAVHCKAGLGRTGTCIGAYLMKHYKFGAAEAIAWMRICRPGCVIGPQQHFLQDLEQRMWHEGDLARLKPNQDASLLRVSPKSVVSMDFGTFFGNKKKKRYSSPKPETNQADSLLAARRNHQKNNQPPTNRLLEL